MENRVQFKIENIKFRDYYESLINRESKNKIEILDKRKFLKWIIENNDVLLHGSNHSDIKELLPKQANCSSKNFGNNIGVYATQDEVLPIFYAIKIE